MQYGLSIQRVTSITESQTIQVRDVMSLLEEMWEMPCH